MDAFILSAVKDRAGLANCIESLHQHCQPRPQRVFVVYQGAAKPVLPEYMDMQVLSMAEGIAYPNLIKTELARLLAERWQQLGLDSPKAIPQAERACSWYYQQLLKLLLFRAFPEIDDDVLVMDSDAVFVKLTRVMDDNGAVVDVLGYPFEFCENGSPPTELNLIEHSHVRFAEKLLPDWRLQHGYSGMVHNMVFQRTMMEEIISKAEKTHGCDFPCAVIKSIDSCNWNAMSEYVLYHHYALTHYPKQRSLEKRTLVDLLYDSATPPPIALSQPITKIKSWMQQHVDMNWAEVQQVGLHGFTDLSSRVQSMDYVPIQEKQRLDQFVREYGFFFISLREGVRFWSVAAHQ